MIRGVDHRVGTGSATGRLPRRQSGLTRRVRASRRHAHRWLLRLALLSLLLRALVPSGFMPAVVAWAPETGPSWFIALCPTGMTAADYALLSNPGLHDSALPQPHHHGGQHASQHSAHEDSSESLNCLFGSALLEPAELAAAGSGVPLLPPDAVSAAVLLPPYGPTSRAAFRPRGPPVDFDSSTSA